MKTRPRDIGTKAESATVKVLVANGFPQCERRALRGEHDAGDITGTPGIAWSVKGGDKARQASDLQIERWLGELETQVRHAKADVGVLVLQRKGVGHDNAHRWWAVMPLSTVALLRVGIKPPPNRLVAADASVRMLLADAVTLLRAAGYGEPDVDCKHEWHGADGGRCPGCGWDSHPIPATPAPPIDLGLPTLPNPAVA